jgi:hypothetical protein
MRHSWAQCPNCQPVLRSVAGLRVWGSTNMPQRFLKPGITSSRKWDGCSWMAQSFYIRLITLVDDFGRYEADPMLLRSHAFPLRDDITAQRVTEMCIELQNHGLANFYASNEKQYFQLTNWNERPRAATSKFPAFDSKCCQTDNKCLQTDSKCYPPSSSSSPPSSPSLFVADATKPKAVRFEKPTLETIKLWMAKAGLPEVEADKFFDHYESNGWKVGHNPMKSLEATLRNWKRNFEQKRYVNSQTNLRNSQSRNIGTLNEGKESEYANVGKIRKLAV